jgi:hypothetical protein
VKRRERGGEDTFEPLHQRSREGKRGAAENAHAGLGHPLGAIKRVGCGPL